MLNVRSARRELDLGNDSLKRLAFRLSAPMVVAQVVNALYNTVDRIYIGHLPDIGETALTGVGVCWPILQAVSAFAALAAFGGSSQASIAMGMDNKEKAERILGSCTAALIGLSAILTAGLLIWGEQLLFLFGASENTIGYALTYIRIYAVGTLFVQLTLGLVPFLNAQGKTRFSMLITAVGAGLNILLDPVLMYGLDLGVAGAAIATVISQAVSAGLAVVFFVRGRSALRFRARFFRIHWPTYLPCIALGSSSFIMEVTESLLSAVFNSSLSYYTADLGVGVMTILSSTCQMNFLIMTGLAKGIQPILSYNYGAGKFARVKAAFRILLLVSLVCAGIGWLTALLCPQIYVNLFGQGLQMADTACWALRIYMSAYLTRGVQHACQQTFVALGNARTSLFLACFRKLILLIPFILIFPRIFSNPMAAIFAAEPTADVIAAITTAFLFLRFYRRSLGNPETASKHMHRGIPDLVRKRS